MNDHDLEQAVLAFLERAGSEPSLTPGAFAAAYGDAASTVRDAIDSALALERGLAGASAPHRVIGGHTVLGELGRGGMGIVYRVLAGGEERALKLLPLAPLLGPRMLERFRREAETLTRLSHPHIVRVHATGMHDEMPFLVMDLVEGEPLDQCARGLDRDAVLSLVATLADTLDAAHREGVLHRDLKPQNVIVRPDGSPVLLDFGLSAIEDASSLTMTGELVGTPRYMAPEQVEGGEVDARTDVYALGLVLYELLVGAPAHAAQGRDAVIASVRSGRITRPRERHPAFGRDLERVVLMALAVDPARRYASAAAFAADVRRAQRGEPVLAPPVDSAGSSVRFVLRTLERTWSKAWRGVSGSSAPAREVTPSSRHEAARLLDRAVGHWIDGTRDQALDAVREALRHDPSDPTAVVLAAHLGDRAVGSLPSELAAARETLRRYESGEPAEAMADVQRGSLSALRPSLAAALLGLTAATRSDPSDAIESLTAATRLLPDSRALPLALAQACRRAGRHEEAVRALRRCTELAPDSTGAWTDLAEELIEAHALDDAEEAIRRASALAPTGVTRLLRCRARLEIRRRRQPEARAILETVLEREPDDIEALYDMAYSHDMDHDMVGAANAYHEVLRREPRHSRALLLLAHLYSGASRGQCGGCDAFFAEHPEYFDLAQAERYLLRCLEADRGADEWVTRTARDVAMRLERREAVIALLNRLTSSDPRTSSVLRLEEVLRRLQQVER